LTGLIAIDESGDLGQRGSRHFVIAALVTSRSRHLLGAYKAIPRDGREIKFYDSSFEERIRVLTEVARADVKIVYLCIDKEKQDESYKSGNALYRFALEEVIRCALAESINKDVNVRIDENSFIKRKDLEEIVSTVSKEFGKNVKGCSKVSSERCVRIADYVAGSVWARYEREIREYYDIIKEKVSVARES